ncbi:5'-3' exonuclease, N-terminal resolvase-like domain, putative [Hepatocystis sp. ex Piliocolobus tephrosceles]|nr:5'-3' exonuclease, N-terminal resolvase-like domain, putative [Hepatocystis sp. ex Piliocolobus tephrosceles]
MKKTLYYSILLAINQFILCRNNVYVNSTYKSNTITCKILKNKKKMIYNDIKRIKGLYYLNECVWKHKKYIFQRPFKTMKTIAKKRIKIYARKKKTNILKNNTVSNDESIIIDKNKNKNIDAEKKYETFVIVDGSSILFKNFFGMPNLTNHHEINISTMYGFIQSLNKIYKLFNPSYISIVFDSKTSNDRKRQLYAKYKIQRKKQPDELYEQLTIASQFCDNIGIKIINATNVESDNYIAMLVDNIYNTIQYANKQSQNSIIKNVQKNVSDKSYNDQIQDKYQPIRTIIVSSDKDLLQLLEYSDDAHNNMNIYICQPNKKYRLIDTQLFMQENGLLPCQYSDYLILAGDKTDGIIGVPSIGEKTSIYLLKKFGSLDYILENLHLLPNKLHDVIINNIENIQIYKQLIKLKCKTNETLVLNDYKQGYIKNFDDFQDMLNKYSLHKLLNKSLLIRR